MVGYLLYIGITLQIRTADVQRYVGRIYHAMQQSQKLRHYALHRIGNKHLIAIQLYLVALQFYIVSNLREIQNTRKMERIIHVQMNMEQWRLVIREQFTIKLVIILILHFRRFASPCRIGIVDYVVLGSLNFLAVFPLLLFAESNRHRQEFAIFVQQLADF